MNEIVVIGAGGHARVVADVIRLTGEFTLHGFIDQVDTQRHGADFEGSRILGGEELLSGLLQSGVRHAIVAIGDNRIRERVGQKLLTQGFKLPALIHPRAIVASTASVGEGAVVFAGAIVNPATSIGAHTIINTAATVDHDCTIGSAVHIAPGAHIAGGVTIGDRTLIGVSAAIKPGVRIGKDAIVGLGAAVISDVADSQTVAGVPARVVT